MIGSLRWTRQNGLQLEEQEVAQVFRECGLADEQIGLAVAAFRAVVQPVLVGGLVTAVAFATARLSG